MSQPLPFDRKRGVLFVSDVVERDLVADRSVVSDGRADVNILVDEVSVLVNESEIVERIFAHSETVRVTEVPEFHAVD